MKDEGPGMEGTNRLSLISCPSSVALGLLSALALLAIWEAF